LIYLEWACAEGEQHQSDDPDVYADLGLMHLETSYLENDKDRQRDARAKARRSFRRALELNSAQPAASPALAWIERRDDGVPNPSGPWKQLSELWIIMIPIISVSSGART
jgi:hypothetical protein